MKRSIIIFALIVTVSTHLSKSQTSSILEFNGYLSGMPSTMWSKEKLPGIGTTDTIYYQGLLHNRLNFNWYPSDKFTASIQFRNQLIYGDFIKMGTLEEGFVSESYFLPLTLQQGLGDKGLLSLSADRLWAQYTVGNLDIKVGRQRINWGQTFAWNPNDIFNSYNFFDFDYVERPGADAVRVQYYTGMASQLDLAVKLDSAANVTAAALYRFNKWNSDFQIITGYLSQPHIDTLANKDAESDLVFGIGYTTDFKGVSLRTETTYLLPSNGSPNQDEYFLLSIGLDYSLPNDIFLATEFYYTSNVNIPAGADLLSFYAGPLTVKNLTFTKYNCFLQASYPITPLLNANIAGMYFADKYLNGFYVGPTIDYSLKENMDLSIVSQYFNFNIENPLGGNDLTSQTIMAFLRFKWSF